MATKRKRLERALAEHRTLNGLSHPNASMLEKRNLKSRYAPYASQESVPDEHSPWWANERLYKEITVCAVKNHCCCKKVG